MRYLPLIALLLPTAAPAQTLQNQPFNMPIMGKAADNPRCTTPENRRISNKDKFYAGKLGEMPNAKPIYTVLNTVDGCPKPISVKRG